MSVYPVTDYRMVFEENGGYLYSDFWPFLIAHFGEKGERKSPMDILKASLAALIGSFEAEESRGYHQGKDAYRAWIKGLSREEDFRLEHDRENVQRRLRLPLCPAIRLRLSPCCLRPSIRRFPSGL